MRRFGLFLLVFVLTLQMSWAAVHYCDDDGVVALAVAADKDSHVHEAEAAGQSDAEAEKMADACCGASHGCHGLHHLMGQADAEFASMSATQMPAASGAGPPLSGLRSRIERPNWLAA